MPAADYTIGKGKLLFKRDGTNGFRDLGNGPEFKITVGKETKEHFSSRSGVQVKDMEVIVKQTANGSIILDEPVIENMELFVMSDAADDISQTSGSLTAQDIVLYDDLWIDVGKKTLSSVVLKNNGGTVTYVLGTDYEVDVDNGLLKSLSTGAITDGATCEVTCDYAAATIKKVNAAESTTVKGHVYFAGDPPAGRKLDVKGYVSMLPEGDLPLIGDDFLQFGFKMEFLTHADYDGLYELIDKGVVA